MMLMVVEMLGRRGTAGLMVRTVMMMQQRQMARRHGLTSRAGKMGEGRRGSDGGARVTVLPAPQNARATQGDARAAGGLGTTGSPAPNKNPIDRMTFIYGAAAIALAMSSVAAYSAIAPRAAKQKEKEKETEQAATKERERERREQEEDAQGGGVVFEGGGEVVDAERETELREGVASRAGREEEKEEGDGGVDPEMGEPVLVMLAAGDETEVKDERGDVIDGPMTLHAAALIDDAIAVGRSDAEVGAEESGAASDNGAVLLSDDTEATSEAERANDTDGGHDADDVFTGNARRVSSHTSPDGADGDAVAAVPAATGAPAAAEAQTDVDEKYVATDGIAEADELTLEALMKRSVSTNVHAVDDWRAVNVAMKQAASDLGLFNEVLEKKTVEMNGDVAKLASTVEARDAAIELLRKDMDVVRTEAEERERQALERQKMELEAENATALVEERTRRVAEMDGIREELNVLAEAFDQRRSDAKARHDLHQLSLACFALDWNRGRGAPLANAASVVKRFANGDPLIEAAIDAMPEAARERGALTASQLKERFRRVRTSAANVSLLPVEGKGGILAYSVAWLASLIRVREEAPASGGAAIGTEATLALAETLLADGKIEKAVAVMEEGFKNSAASHIIQDWVFEAKVCASVDAILDLTRAHAMITAALVADDVAV